jgi:sucrose phosphorylase
MLALEGVPAFYIHSLLGTRNDYKHMEEKGYNRAINRHQWELEGLRDQLGDPDTENYVVFNRLQQIIKIRQQQPAFHPNATQFTLHTGDHLFSFWRQSMDRRQSIFCIYNVSDENQSLLLRDLNLISTDSWRDLISGRAYEEHDELLDIEPYQVLWITNF